MAEPHERNEKVRLDDFVVRQGWADTKSRAQALINSGKIYKGERCLNKPGLKISDPDEIYLKEPDHPWVSRGGLKLIHAIELFNPPIEGAIAVDVGASTGGFTDVLLHFGATKVYAVDVGTDQLHEKLKADSRVISLEKTNARDLTATHIPELVDIITCDTSFISLEKVLPAALSLTKPDAWLIALIKPQFEVGKGKAQKNVVKDKALHAQVCERVKDWMIAQGWQVKEILPSPITGPKGNREFLIIAVKEPK